MAGTAVVVKATDDDGLAAALATAGLVSTRSLDGGFVVDATAEAVGCAANRGDVILVELRTADGRGLEQLFMSLTKNDGADVR